jgi:hypothetical protein
VTKGISSKGQADAEPDADGGSGEEGGKDDDHEPGLDDEFEDVVDHFESSYNFRFEEPYVHTSTPN